MGAVYKAYEDRSITEGYDFSFFGAPGKEFQRLGFEGSTIANFWVSSGGSQDMADYDCFVIYGALPAPHHCWEYACGVSTAAYSAQVRRAVVRDWLFQYRSARLLQELMAITQNPIFVLSSNIRQDDPRVESQAKLDKGAALIASIITPAFYISFPPTLFSEGFQPDPKYYHDSLNVYGVTQPKDGERRPFQDLVHLNQDGGILVLTQIMERLRQVL